MNHSDLNCPSDKEERERENKKHTYTYHDTITIRNTYTIETIHVHTITGLTGTIP